MTTEPAQQLPTNGRLISAGMAGAAAVGLLLNHFAIEPQSIARLMILCLGPLALFIGIGGAIEPRILWSVGKYGQHLPVIYQGIGGALGGLGVIVTLLLVMLVYGLGPPDPQPARQRKQVATSANRASRPHFNQPAAPSKPERQVTLQTVMCLTYDRSRKRWVEMDEAAMQVVRREDLDGVTTLHYVEGEHGLLKVLWPDVLEDGDRFTVELQGANSIEMVDLEGADANARASLPANDRYIVVEFLRDQDKIAFRCDGQSPKTYYASGKLRGDEAKTALLATGLRPGFSIKKGERMTFRRAQIAKR